MGTGGRAFLAVFDPVYREYQKRLGGRIDFEDMILRAARYAEEGRYRSPFRHILVGELQDISQGRARLTRRHVGWIWPTPACSGVSPSD